MDSTRHGVPAWAPVRTPWTVAALAIAIALAPVTVPRAADGGPAAPRGAASCVVGFRLVGEVPGSDAWGLESPRGLAVDHRGDILVADTGNHRVLVVSPSGEIVTEFGGFGWGDGQFDAPTGLAVYTGFYVYVLDEGNRRVQRFDVEGDFIDHVIRVDEAGSPVALAVGQAGELLLVDADAQAVLARSQFDEDLAPIGRFGSGEGGLVRPRAVAWGPSREIAVADAGTGTVEVFDEFGSSLYSLSSPDTLEPVDVLFDPSGSLIVADLHRRRVVAYPPGGGRPSASFDGGEAGLEPSALAVHPDGVLLVLDGERRRILLIEMVHGTCRSDR